MQWAWIAVSLSVSISAIFYLVYLPSWKDTLTLITAALGVLLGLAARNQQKNKGDMKMVEQKWTRFANTGSIEDYLSYKCCHSAEGMGGDATRSQMAGGEYRNGGMGQNGAEHNTDGHGTFRSPSGGI